MAITAQAQPLPPTTDDTLRQYAADTWQSFAALAYPSGLPADNISAGGARALYTSPTNIGAYLWSTVAARDLGIIPPLEAQQRIAATLETLAKIERHAASGMFYNWYHPAGGAKLTTWPANGRPIEPFLSTVDNGWLAAALIVVSSGLPELRAQAEALLNRMDFGFFLNPADGLLYGGCWPPDSAAVRKSKGDRLTGRGRFTGYVFGALNTEPRISSYIGIAMGSLPPSHYFRMARAFPGRRNGNGPAGVTRTYLGVEVFEGHCTYAGMQIVPSWGGSMFEALMPALFVPEAEWGPESWGINHPLYVQAQIYHGMQEAGYGYWGFSPANDPSGGYAAYGVEAIGMLANGYHASGVVTPHASFLALEFAPREALENLSNLCRNFDAYGKWGFWDSVNVQTGQVSKSALALDQGMVMAALANALCDNQMKAYFSEGIIQRAIQPLLAMETFTAGRRDWYTDQEDGHG